MLRIAIRMLAGDRARYITLISGLAFVALLFVQQGSVFQGLIGRTARPVDTIGAPIWVADPTLRYVDESKPLKDTDLFRVRSVPGVKWAVPILMRQVQMVMPDGRYQGVRLIGLDSGSLIGMPATALQGEIADVKSPDAIVLGTAELQRLGNPEVGATFQINDRLARVAAIVETRRDFLSNPYAFTTMERALRYTQSQRKQVSFVLAAPADGLGADQVAKAIRMETGLAAYTRDALRELTIDYYLKNTGIPITFGISLLLVFVVGMAIAGQTFYSFALQNERYFAALKAMGTGTLTLTKMIMLQALMVGGIGYGLGAGIASLIGWLGRGTEQVPYLTTWPLLAVSLAATIFICLVSSLHGIHRVVRLEPAAVFR
jgi:putative ABC transport system permease protein